MTTIPGRATGSHPSHPRTGAALAPLLAAVVTAVSFCAATALAGREPFGTRSRLTNDLGAQFVPFHAELRDLLTGRAPGDLLWSWTSGGGVPFLPDYATYLSSPLAPLVVLFPRDRVDLAVYVLTVLKLALAAGLMTTLLRALRPAGNPWLAALAGVAYGTCGWAVDDGSYVPMWLDGFVGLPLLALVAHWAREGRRLVLGTVLVALVWWANYYTAYMASVGTALLLVTLLAAEGCSVREAARAILRFAGQGVLGVAATAVLLVPTVTAVGVSQPSPPGDFLPHPWSELAARLMPGSEGVGFTPGLTVGTVVLLLAATLPVRRVIPLRARVVWVLALGALVWSLQVPFTQSAWHGFDVPNGSPFRQAFVVCAWLVVIAWLAVADGLPALPELGFAVVVVAALAWVARGSATPRKTWLDPLSLRVLAGVLLVSVLLLAAARLRPRLAPVVAVLLLAVVAGESTWTTLVVDRHRQAVLPTTTAWSAFVPSALAAARAAEPDWPPYRFATTGSASVNEPAILGVPGFDYYSSTMPALTSQTFVGLGARWAGYGRSLRLATDDPALRALLAVRTSYAAGTGSQTHPALPVARLAPTSSIPPGASDVFSRRARLLGDGVYTLPPVQGPTRLAAGATARLTVTCPAETLAQASLPGLKGTLVTSALPDRRDLTGRDGVVPLGTAGNGPVAMTLRAERPVALPAHPVGCLDTAALDERARAASAVAPAVEAAGHAVRATWPAPQRGQVVLATAASPAWTCTVDGRPAPAGALSGLLAVELAGGSSVACSHGTPGLAAGAAVSGAAALVTALVGAVSVATRRRARVRSARGA